MKTNVVKNILLSLVITAITASLPANVSAQLANIQPATDNVTEISYVGNNSDFFKFEVNLKQPNSQKLLLRVLDENGIELYRETVISKEFSKLIKVTRNDYARLQFVVTGNGVNVVKSFSINAEVSDNFLIREVNNK